jgi:NAD+ synthase (glutamine-hydrolysing)
LHWPLPDGAYDWFSEWGVDYVFSGHYHSHRVIQHRELKEVNQQQPTAELRPSTEGQTDESDLMPYDLLDAIERAAIRDKYMPLDVYQFVKIEFTQYDRRQLEKWVIRFFRLWSRTQWKRERYAPSFHLDDENLDPKTWCRFPILSGGFERELDELRAWIAANEPVTEPTSKR